MKTDVTEIQINGIAYVPKGSEAPVPGKRAVIVVDRGWIFAGDVTEANGRIVLTRAVWVFSWSGCGLDGVIVNPTSGKVNLRPMPNGVDLPAEAEIFRIPVADGWGLK